MGGDNILLERVWLLLSVVVMVLIEFIIQMFRIKKISEEEEFVMLFHNKLFEYVDSNGNDEIFVWLTRNASKMQRLMGSFGHVSYRPPFANYMINNYQIIINGIDEIKKEIEFGYNENQHFDLIRSTILKYSGSVENRHEYIVDIMKNPIKLFVLSIRRIVLLPIMLLHEFGILGTKLNLWFKESYLISFISGVIALITILSTVITIILGWTEFHKIIMNIIS